MDDKEPTVGLDRLGEPIIDRAPNRPRWLRDGPVIKGFTKGATWGLVVGFAVARLNPSTNFLPFGYYVQDANLVVLFWVSVGVVVGAAIGVAAGCLQLREIRRLRESRK